MFYWQAGEERVVRFPPFCLYPGESLGRRAGIQEPDDPEGLGCGQVVVIGVLALEQGVVGSNLPLQSLLDVHELLALLVLLLSVSTL
jgi:hypothetical protein